LRPHHFKAQTHFFLSHRAERTFGTLLLAFLGYAIDGRLSSGSPLLTEMNGSEGGAGLYFRAGREVKAIREDCPPGKEERCQGAVIYLDLFPEALKIQTGSENHWRYLALRFAIRSTTSAFPFCNIPRRPPFQSLRKKTNQSQPYLSKASSVIFPAPGEFTQPIPQSSAQLK